MPAIATSIRLLLLQYVQPTRTKRYIFTAIIGGYERLTDQQNRGKVYLPRARGPSQPRAQQQYDKMFNHTCCGSVEVFECQRLRQILCTSVRTNCKTTYCSTKYDGSICRVRVLFGNRILAFPAAVQENVWKAPGDRRAVGDK